MHYTEGSKVLFQAIEKYNSIFKFLLLVRRTQSALHSLWADSMFRNRAVRRREVREVMSEEEREDTVTQTRQHMIFLVDNLQYYLMADVLDSQTSGLKAKLMKTSSFEDVKNYHDQFLTQVQASIFLFNEPVSKCLRDTMSVCLKFTQSSSLSSQVNLSLSLVNPDHMTLILSSHWPARPLHRLLSAQLPAAQAPLQSQASDGTRLPCPAPHQDRLQQILLQEGESQSVYQ